MVNLMAKAHMKYLSATYLLLQLQWLSQITRADTRDWLKFSNRRHTLSCNKYLYSFIKNCRVDALPCLCL